MDSEFSQSWELIHVLYFLCENGKGNTIYVMLNQGLFNYEFFETWLTQYTMSKSDQGASYMAKLIYNSGEDSHWSVVVRGTRLGIKIWWANPAWSLKSIGWLWVNQFLRVRKKAVEKHYHTCTQTHIEKSKEATTTWIRDSKVFYSRTFSNKNSNLAAESICFFFWVCTI